MQKLRPASVDVKMLLESSIERRNTNKSAELISVVNLATVEVSLGAVALSAAAAGSFLIAGGRVDQLAVFTVTVLMVFAVAAAIVVSRITQYRHEMRTRLYQLLPSERACQPDAPTLENLAEHELFVLLDTHLKQQEALLSANCHVLIQGGTDMMHELRQTEDELWQLRSEIAALEDQFRTDQSQSQWRGPTPDASSGC